MIDKLAPCPFCCNSPTATGPQSNRIVYCKTIHCALRGVKIPLAYWNKRCTYKCEKCDMQKECDIVFTRSKHY